MIEALACLAAGAVCLLAVVGAFALLFGSVTVMKRNGSERVYRLGGVSEPDSDDVLAGVVNWACARQRDGVSVTGDDVLRLIAHLREPKSPTIQQRGTR